MEVEAESIRIVTVSKADSPTPGEFNSLSDALAAVKPNTCIRILAGVYEEPPIMVDVDDIQVIADGVVSIICRAMDSVLKLRSRRTLLKGLKLILVLPEEVETDGLSCIVVENGSVTMEECHISGSAGGVLVMPSAPDDAPEPVFRSCHITECKDFAIKVMGGSNPHFDQCQIYNIKGFGIVACGDARFRPSPLAHFKRMRPLANGMHHQIRLGEGHQYPAGQSHPHPAGILHIHSKLRF